MKKQKPQSGLAPGDYMIYTITIANITTDEDTKIIIDRLGARGIPGSYQHIYPVLEEQPGIEVPRLCTFWRGDSQEQEWQHSIREAIEKISPVAAVTITAVPWAPAPGYPMGAI